MSEELEPVNQVFTADMEPWISELRKGVEEARQFADDNRVASEGVSSLGHSADTSAEEIKHFADQNASAIKDLQAMRDQALAEGRALSDLRDHAAEAASEEKHVRDASVETATAMGHLRDEAALATREVEKLGRKAEETAAKLDLMSLSGLSTVSHLSPLMTGMVGLIALATTVAPAFAAAGLGIAAIGFSAGSAYKAVQPAVQALGTLNSLTPGTKAYTAAMAQFKSLFDALPPTAQKFTMAIGNAQNAFQNWSTTMIPLTERVLTPFMNLVPTLLGTVQKLASGAAGPLISLAHQLSTALNSAGFQQFISTMISQMGPAISAITHLAGALLGLLGHALEALAPLATPLLNMITGLVKALQGPLIALMGVLQQAFFQILQAIQPLIPGLSRLATMLITDVGSGLIALVPIVSQIIQLLGPIFLKVLDDLEPVLANMFTPNSPFFIALKMIPPILQSMMPLFSALAALLSHPIFAQLAIDVMSFVVAGKAVIGLLGLLSGAFKLLGISIEATPVGWIITAIAALVFIFYELWQHCAAFRDFWKSLWSDIKSIMTPVTDWIHNVIKDMERWWQDHGETVIRILRAAWVVIQTVFKTYMEIVETQIRLGLAIIENAWKVSWDIIRTVVVTVWDVIRTVVTSAVKIIQDVIDAALAIIHGHWQTAWKLLSDAASTGMKAIVTIITDIAKGFDTLLYNAGRDLIMGLIHGIESMASSVWSLIGNIASGISSAFSKVLHIFSPSRVFYQHGVDTMLGWINAVNDWIPVLRSTMTQAAQAVMPDRTVPWLMPRSYGPQQVPSGGLSAPTGSVGNLIIQVDGRNLFTISQEQLYWYNMRNSGAVTGVLKPA